MTTTRVLDRVQEHDERSRAFGISRLVAEPPEKAVWWTGGPVLDQGSEGHCGGFAAAGEAAASPFRVRGVNDAYGHAFYYEAKDRGLDPWGREEGTSTLAMLKVGKIRGLWDSYAWAFGLDDARRNLRVGPFLFGAEWLTGCFTPDSDGFIRPTGVVEGGHLIVVTGWSPNYLRKGPTWRIRQSWGIEHGRNGNVYLSEEGMEDLLVRRRGEAGVPVGRHVR